MTTWVEVLTLAFATQLAVLPGEKVQFIIAGLSTRYKPWLVVSAAGAAFALWTAVEIWVGEALTRLLPGIYLDALTASLFLLFAVQLLRSMPEKDTPGSVETDGSGIDVSGLLPSRFQNRDLSESGEYGAFAPIFAMMAFGEFGDKTQIVTIGLAAQYGAHTAIWAGEMLAIIPVSIANAYFFHTFSHKLDMRKAHVASAALFAFFAGDFFLRLLFDFSVWETAVQAMANLGSALV
ncbi:TMEM165/GDT1 family protein [Halorussus halophilus]|uniref:TMEM165/GDT1 family protein n=1 Tax=Halorussus halophilus TaxID=2650975 RepID=UPI0013010DAC|nr:TMEM165/GDT1 family protein [Halorussus halophilus]